MTDYRQLAVEEALAQGVDPHLILRQMRQESGGDPAAVSPKGARGLMQLMPATARDLGVDPRDPVQNIRGGVAYMKQQLDSFGGDPRLAAAAYNAGPGAVRRYGGVPPYVETRDYVRAVAGRPSAAAPDPGYDQDVFGGLGGAVQVAPAAPTAQAAPGRRNADGSIDIGDIDRSTNPEFLARQRERLGYDPDVFPEPAPPIGAASAGADKPTPGYLAAKQALGKPITDTLGALPKPLRGFYLDRLTNANGASAGFLDELAGGISYGGTALVKKLAPLTGKDVPYSPEEARRVTQDTFRGIAAENRRERPVSATANEVAGAFAPTRWAKGLGEWVGAAKSLPAAATRSAAVGAAYGAVAGAGNSEGDLGDRGRATVGGGVLGGLAGGGLGLAVPVIAPRAARILDPVVAAVRPQVERVSATANQGIDDLVAMLQRSGVGERHPDGLAGKMNFGPTPPKGAPAARGAAPAVQPVAPPAPPAAPPPGLNLKGKSARVPRILAKTIERDRLSYDDLLAALQGRAPNTMPFETAGENMVGLAEHLGQLPGFGRDYAIERLTQRSATAPDRIKKVVDNTLGGSGDYFKTKNDLIIRRAEQAKPHFELAFPQPVDADHFENVFRPIVARLPKGALEHAYDLARREGRVPEELGLQKGALSDGRVAPAAPPEQVSAEDLAALRAGRKAPSQGPGLLEFVSKNGGLKDYGGELRAKDLDIWHQKRPFVAKLLRPDGLSDEAMAQKLFEAGYFPEKVAGRMDSADNMTRVTAQDLYDAIDQELAGKARYARAANDPGRAGRLDELERRLREAGVDPRTVTPKQASVALGQLRDDIARNEAFAQGHAPGPLHDEPVQVVNPTLETLHYVKMGLDEALEKYRNPVTGKLELERTAAGRADSATRHDLGVALRETNPDYAAAMQVWGDRSADLHALDLGREVFSPKFDMQSEQLTDAWAKMSKTSRDHYRKGVGEALVAKVRAGGGGVKTMRDLLRSEEFRARVRLAFRGQKAYDQFIANAMREVKMQERFNQVNSGSQTFRRQAQADFAGQDGLDAGDLADAGFTAVTGNPGAAIKGVTRKVFKNEAMKTQDVLRDPDANKLLGEALFDDGDTLMRLLQHLKLNAKPKAALHLSRRNLARGVAASAQAKERR